jgi:hypothetical protein
MLCRICKIEKSSDDFYLRPDSKSNKRRTECRQCLIASRVTQRPKTKEQNRKYLVESYGITLDDYEVIRVKQEFRCAICGLHEQNNRHGRLFIDHDHDTGKVRGLLCNDCNTGVGKFRDNPMLLHKAAVYVEGK